MQIDVMSALDDARGSGPARAGLVSRKGSDTTIFEDNARDDNSPNDFCLSGWPSKSEYIQSVEDGVRKAPTMEVDSCHGEERLHDACSAKSEDLGRARRRPEPYVEVQLPTSDMSDVIVLQSEKDAVESDMPGPEILSSIDGVARCVESDICVDRESRVMAEDVATTGKPSETQKPRLRDIGDFEASMTAVVQKSNAERALDRETVRCVGRSERLLSPPYQHAAQGTPDRMSEAKQTGAVANRDQTTPPKLDDKREKPGGVPPNVTEGETWALPLFEPHPRDEPQTVPLQEEQWVKYVNPEGYSYLHNPVTGDSQWIHLDDHETPRAHIAPTCVVPEGTQPDERVLSDYLSDRENNSDDMEGTASEGKGTCVVEGECASTCGVSQSSQDTSHPDARNSVGETAMHLAATQHSLRGLSVLLAAGADVNAVDAHGRTPLHRVCGSCHPDAVDGQSTRVLQCIELLLSAGALEDVRDETGTTPLHLCAAQGNLSAAQALLAAGAVGVADAAGNTPLHLAAEHDHFEILQVLVVGSGANTVRADFLHAPGDDSSLTERRRGESRLPPSRGIAWEAIQSRGDGDGSGYLTTPAGQDQNPLPLIDGIYADVAPTRSNESVKREMGTERISSDSSGSKNLGRVMPNAADQLNDEGKFAIVPANQKACVRDSSGSRLQYNNSSESDRYSSLNKDKRGKLEVWNRFFENAVQETSKRSEGDGDVDMRSALPDDGRERLRYGSDGDGRRGTLRGRHLDGAGARVTGWPQPLSEGDYIRVLRAALAPQDEQYEFPPLEALSMALLAACIASRPDDAIAVLHLVQNRKGGGADVRDAGGRTPLHHVCRRGDIEMARLLCRAGAEPEARDRHGNTPLIVAASGGRTGCLHFLLEGGVDPNGGNAAGDMPLHAAVLHGNLSCVKTLLTAGAIISRRNKLGFTPKEAFLDTWPTFSRHRPPKSLRVTLQYVEDAEAILGNLISSPWTAQDSDWSEAAAGMNTTRRRQTDKPDPPLPRLRHQQPLVFDASSDFFMEEGKQETCIAKHTSISRIRSGSRKRAATAKRPRERGERMAAFDETRDGDEAPRSGKPQVLFGGETPFVSGPDFLPTQQIAAARLTEAIEVDARVPRRQGCFDEPSTSGDHSSPEYCWAEDHLAARESPPQFCLNQEDFGSSGRDNGRGGSSPAARKVTTDIGLSKDDSGDQHDKPRSTRGSCEPTDLKYSNWGGISRAIGYILGGWAPFSQDSRGRSRVIVGISNHHAGNSNMLLSSDGDTPTVNTKPSSMTTKTSLTPPPNEGNTSGIRPAAIHVEGMSTIGTKPPTAKMPLALAPMQPPPDVLKAIKDRARKGQGRRDLTTPPADVAAALAEMEERKARGGRGGDTADGDVGIEIGLAAVGGTEDVTGFTFRHTSDILCR